VAVNTKLKTDPFLKDNDWNTGNNINGTEKSGENNNKDLVIIKKKENNNQQSEVSDSGNITSVNDKNNKGKLIPFFFDTFLQINISFCFLGTTITGISLVSADYDDTEDE
jgi:hypothetical protein